MGKTRWQDRDPEKRKAAAERYRAKPEVRAHRNEQRRWKRRLARGVCPECQGAVSHGPAVGQQICKPCAVVWTVAKGEPVELVRLLPHVAAPVSTATYSRPISPSDSRPVDWVPVLVPSVFGPAPMGRDRIGYGKRAHDLARARCRFVHAVVERRIAIERIRERCHFEGYVWPWAA